jgi:hypothetical protein
MYSKDGLNGEQYFCLQEWPEGIHVQHGSRGIVFSKNGNYSTAFFEAFPSTSITSTYIRGEGETVRQAEEDAFNKYVLMRDCANHEYERFKNTELGVCIHCNSKKDDLFPPTKEHKCSICSKESVNFTVPEIKIEKKENIDDLFSSPNLFCFQHYKEELNKEIQRLSYIDNYLIMNEDAFYSTSHALTAYFSSFPFFSDDDEDYIIHNKIKRNQKKFDMIMSRFEKYFLEKLISKGVFNNAPAHLKTSLFTRNEIRTILLLNNYNLIRHDIFINEIESGTLSLYVYEKSLQHMSSLFQEIISKENLEQKRGLA